MPSEAQLARVNTMSGLGKVAHKAASLSEQVRALETFQTQAVCCGLFNSANAAIPSGAWTPITFDTENYDVYEMHSGANPSRVTCVIPGKYIVSACAKWASSVSHVGGAGIRLYLNGITVLSEFYFYSCDVRAMIISGTVHMNTIGDYVEAYVMQNTGAPVNILTLSLYSPVLGVHKYG